MKRSELKKQIEEAIVEILNEVDIDKTRGTAIMSKTSNPSDIKKFTDRGVDIELREQPDSTK
jgi:hypothetical protein